MLKLIYAQEAIDSSGGIFLAGPTPRSPDVPSWRPEALRLFNKFKYDSTLYLPEPVSGSWEGLEKTEQIEWEERGLTTADVIMFWIPREMATMPALTTNDEWGTWKHSGKVILGTPNNAVSVGYQEYYAKKLKIPLAHTLERTVLFALDMFRVKSRKRIQ